MEENKESTCDNNETDISNLSNQFNTTKNKSKIECQLSKFNNTTEKCFNSTIGITTNDQLNNDNISAESFSENKKLNSSSKKKISNHPDAPKNILSIEEEQSLKKSIQIIFYWIVVGCTDGMDVGTFLKTMIVRHKWLVGKETLNICPADRYSLLSTTIKQLSQVNFA